MVEYFKNALTKAGLSGMVIASNSQMSPALLAADDFFISPLIYGEEYIPFLVDKCQKLKIDLLVPLFDIDLPILSINKARFEEAGTFVAVSDIETIDICNDKFRMYTELTKMGIKCPETFLPCECSQGINSSYFVKPRFGMGSLGLFKASSETELESSITMCQRKIRESYLKYESATLMQGQEVIIQQAKRGQEYGLDVVCDFEGNYMTTLVRKKIAMRAGETDEAVTLGGDDMEFEILSSLGEKLARVLRPKGLIDIDVICVKKSGIAKKSSRTLTPWVIDINARFGGGYPFSQLAGADVPSAYLYFLQGRGDEAMGFLKPAARIHGYKEIIMKKV